MMTCTKCGKTFGKIEDRACDCKAAVTVNLRATATGKGGAR